jgi:hypothetical protein
MMNTRVSLVALAVALLLPVGALAKAESDVLESLSLMHVVGTLVSEPDGSVSSVHVDSRLDASLLPAVERTMRGMRFRPAVVNGVAQQVNSAFELSLAARKTTEGNYRVSVDGVSFAPVKGGNLLHPDDETGTYQVDAVELKPPVYPMDAQMKGAMGRVLLAIRFDRAGNCMDAAVVSSMLYETSEGRAPGGRRALVSFERAALDAARRWKAKITLGRGAEGADGYTAMTPVVFTLTDIDLDADGQWLSVKRMPLREIPWKQPEGLKEVNDVGHSSGIATLGGGGIELAQSARGTPVL